MRPTFVIQGVARYFEETKNSDEWVGASITLSGITSLIKLSE